MSSRLKSGFILVGLGFAAALSHLALAQDPNAPQSLREKLSQSIEVASQNQLQIVNVSATPLPSIYEVELNTGEMLYTDIGGDYLFAGDMYQTTSAGLLNLSSSKRQIRNMEKIAAIPEDQMIRFTPETVKATITVFTDVDCTYCRALHRDLEKNLAAGIEVRYLAYPRGGVNAESYGKMVSVWCSDDRSKAMTQAKNGQNIPEKTCDSPVLEHYELGNELGVTGTPALVFPDGRVIPGYLETERLAAMLKIN